jgi:hypothetical protein
MELSAQRPGKRLTSSKIWRKSTYKKNLKYQSRTRELKNRVFQRTASGNETEDGVTGVAAERDGDVAVV